MSGKLHAGKLMYGGPDAVLWKIQDFLSLLDKNQACIVSPSFSHGNKTWYIELYFGTQPQRTCDIENFVCLSASPKTHSNIQHFVYKCGIRKKNGGLYSCIDFTEFYLNSAYLLPISEFFSHTDELVSRESVTFMVEFRHESLWCTLTETLAATSSVDKHALPSICYFKERGHSKCLDILSQNLKDLYLKKQHCDITFQVGDEEFYAHKLILASRSTVFASMTEVKEESGKVKVYDCEPKVFNKFLLYLYSGMASSLSANDSLQLYSLADKYQVCDLKPVCIERMKKTLTLDNFCEVIELASRHEESALLTYLKKYFIKNAKFILSTERWGSFMKEDTQLVNQLFLLLVSNGPSD